MITVNLWKKHGNEYDIIAAARQSYGASETKRPEQLLTYLMKHGHGVPFEFAGVVFKVKAPLYVMRHLYTYRMWSRSEKSMRYVDMTGITVNFPSLSYMHDSVKETATNILWETAELLNDTYKELRRLGVHKEDARTILPMATMSEAMFKIDLRNFQHFLEQRLAKDTQEDTRLVAQLMFNKVYEAFPMWSDVFVDLHPDLDYGDY